MTAKEFKKEVFWTLHYEIRTAEEGLEKAVDSGNSLFQHRYWELLTGMLRVAEQLEVISKEQAKEIYDKNIELYVYGRRG